MYHCWRWLLDEYEWFGKLDKLGIDAHKSGSLSTFCGYIETLLTGLWYHIYVTLLHSEKVKRNTSVKRNDFPYWCFFYKQQGNVREVVYTPAITQSYEGLSETLLGLLDAVLGELRKQNSYITNMYIKSKNASSYHRNFAAFKFCIKSINPNVQSFCLWLQWALFTTKYYFIVLSQVNN